MEDSARLGSATWMRILLSIMVVISHAFPIAGQNRDYLSPLGVNYSLGTVAVDGFFALSGFFLYTSVTRHIYVEFLARRFIRLFPLLTLSIILTALSFEIANFFGLVKISQFDLLAFIYTNLDLVNLNRQLNIAGAFPNNPIPGTINGSLWTLNYEFWACLILLIWWMIVKSFIRANKTLFILPCFAYSFYCVAIHVTEQGNFNDFAFRLLPTFLFGCAMAYTEERQIIKLSKNVAAWIFILMSISLLFSIIYNFYLWISIIIFPILLIPMKTVFAKIRHPRFDVAYGIFLFGFPFSQFLVALGLEEPIILGILATLLSIIVAIFCEIYFEKHFSFRSLKTSILSGSKV